VVGNLNNYAINGRKEQMKTFVGVMKPTNKISTLVIYDNGLDPQFVLMR
jgi:hypothetical protein